MVNLKSDTARHGINQSASQNLPTFSIERKQFVGTGSGDVERSIIRAECDGKRRSQRCIRGGVFRGQWFQIEKLWLARLIAVKRDLGDLIEKAKIPQAVNGSFQLPPLLAPSTAQNLAELRQVPKDFRNERKVPSIQLPESGKDRDEHWEWTTVKWKAPNTFSNPRYFEDRMLERHGHQSSERLQPLVSGARFFATIPMIPYLMAVSEPQEKEYTLGYYRTGSDVPSLRQRPPYERRGVLSEAAVVTGLFLLVP